ncbi:hypothetical protein Neosp_001250 [[Neocosmospora] mangrovei]
MLPTLVVRIVRRFPTLEWLVLAPSRTNAPRPFTTQAEKQFLEKRVRMFAQTIKDYTTLKRIAFAIPDAQIGNSIIHDIYDGSETMATPSERKIWFRKLGTTRLSMALERGQESLAGQSK